MKHPRPRACTCALLLSLAVAVGALADEGWRDVGNRVLKLGDLTLHIPPGWVRLSAEEEKTEEAWLFHHLDRDGDIAVHFRIEQETTDYDDVGDRRLFVKVLKESLAEEGWQHDTFVVGELRLHRFAFTDDEGDTVHLVLRPVGKRIYTTYIGSAEPGFPVEAEGMLLGFGRRKARPTPLPAPPPLPDGPPTLPPPPPL